MPLDANTKTQEAMGRKLRDIRDEKGLSQDDAAQAVGISVTYYAGIERGEENPTLAVLESICKALRIKSSQILPF